jgi:hypothetical protein
MADSSGWLVTSGLGGPFLVSFGLEGGAAVTQVSGFILTSGLGDNSLVSLGILVSLPAPTITSVLNTILDQTVAAVQGLNFTLNGNIVPVIKKKLAKNVQEVDQPTQITVTGKVAIDEMEWWAFTNTVKMVYKVDIVIISPNNFDEQANIPIYTLWRQKIRTLFAKPGVYSKPVFDQNVRMGEFEDHSMIDTNYDYQGVGLDVITTEQGS